MTTYEWTPGCDSEGPAQTTNDTPQGTPVEQYVADVVASFPALSPEQLDRLRALGWGPR